MKGRWTINVTLFSIVACGLINGISANPDLQCPSNAEKRTIRISELGDPKNREILNELFQQYADAGDVQITTHIHGFDGVVSTTFQTTNSPPEATTKSPPATKTSPPIETTPKSPPKTTKAPPATKTNPAIETTPKSPPLTDPPSGATTKKSTAGDDGAGSCKNGGCYWLHYSKSINYTEANKICQTNGSVIARIPNEKVYNTTVQAIRSAFNDSADIWVGMNITWNLQLRPQDSFLSINSTNSDIKGSNPYINIVRSNRWQGMKNTSPKSTLDGVICQNLVPFPTDDVCNFTINSNEHHYCVMMREVKINYDKANKICSTIGAKIARIPNYSIYIEIVKAIWSISPTNNRMWIQAENDWAMHLTDSFLEGYSRSWAVGYPVILDQESGVSLTLSSNHVIQRRNHAYSEKLGGVVCKLPCSSGMCCLGCNMKVTLWEPGSFNYSEAEQLCREKDGTVAIITEICPNCHYKKTGSYLSEIAGSYWTATNVSWQKTTIKKDDRFYEWFDDFPTNKTNITTIMLEVQGNDKRKIQTYLAKPDAKGYRFSVLCRNISSTECNKTGLYDETQTIKGAEGLFLLISNTKLTYVAANESCLAHCSQIANIPDQATLDLIGEELRFDLKNRTKRKIWIAVDMEWIRQKHPCNDAHYKLYSETSMDVTGPVSISVAGNASSYVDGMKSHDISALLDGVVCWRPRNESCLLDNQVKINEEDVLFKDCNGTIDCDCYLIELGYGSTLMTFDEARNICRERNSTVMKINDALTMTAIRDYINKNLARTRASVLIGVLTNETTMNNTKSCPSANDDKGQKVNLHLEVDQSDCRFTFLRADAEFKTNGVMCHRRCPTLGNPVNDDKDDDDDGDSYSHTDTSN